MNNSVSATPIDSIRMAAGVEVFQEWEDAYGRDCEVHGPAGYKSVCELIERLVRVVVGGEAPAALGRLAIHRWLPPFVEPEGECREP